MELTTSIRISEEVALFHYSGWVSSGLEDGRAGDKLCAVSLQLPSNGWNVFHICAMKGWTRLVEQIEDDVRKRIAESLDTVPCFWNTSTLSLELATAMSQVRFTNKFVQMYACHWNADSPTS